MRFCNLKLRRFILSCMLMVIMFPLIAEETNEITIGSVESTTQYFPLSPDKTYVYSEIVYDQESLSDLRNNSIIEKIAFHGAVTVGGTVGSFDVYIANTELNKAPESCSDLSAMTLVYSGSLTIDSFEDMGNVLEIELQEEFKYTGKGLHLVTIAKEITGTYYFSYQRVVGACNFGYNEGQLSGGSFSNYRPVITITSTGGEESVINTIVVGTQSGYDASYYGAPITTSSNKSMSETLYTAEELGMGGTPQLIKNISYSGWSSVADNGEQFQITVWMGNCKFGKYEGNEFEAFPTENMTQVYDGAVTIAKGGSYNECMDLMSLDLGDGFPYAGDNLLVVVKCETTTPKRVYWAYDSSKQNSSIYEDCSGDNELTGICRIYTNGMPVTKLTYEPYNGELPPFIDTTETTLDPSIVLHTDKAVGSMIGMIFWTNVDEEGNLGGVMVDYGDGVLVDRPFSGNLSLNDEVRGPVIKIYRSNPNVAIEHFYCYSAELSNVELYEKELLTVDLHNNNLSQIDLANCPNIEHLNLSRNKFFEFEYNSDKLKELILSRNELEQLRISNCTKLEYLDVSINILRSPAWIEMPLSTDMNYLDVSYNTLSELDLSGYLKLQTLICNHNRLESLNLKNNENLKVLKAYYQGLSTLNLRACPNLEVLDVQGTLLDWLDLSNNPNIYDLNISMTKIADIELNKCPKLKTLKMSDCSFESIDLSANKSLEYLDCSNNNMPNINVENNTMLEYLNCSNNGMNNLDVTMLTYLKTLILSNNKLSSIDTKSNIKLGWLDISTNNFSEYNPISNPELYYINCANNMLTELSVLDMIHIVSVDVSANKLDQTALEDLFISLPDIQGIEIEEEDLSWKGNINYNNNPGTKTADTEILTIKGWKHNYAEDLLGDASAMIVVPQTLVNTRLIFSIQTGDETFDVDWGDGNRITYTTETYTGAFTNPEGIVGGTNIKIYAPETTLLATANNGINAIMVNNMPKLKVLTCSGNNISSLDLTQNPELEELQCGDNPLTTLELPEDNKLVKLYCNNTLIKNLDLSNVPELQELDLNENNLHELNLSSSSKLVYLSAYNNELETIDLSNCKKLREVYLSKNALTSLDLAGNTLLKTASFTDNKIKTFDATTLTCLEYLYVTNNGMQELKLNNMLLVQLIAGNNAFTEIDLSNCSSLGVLDMSNSKLTSVDISQNPQLDWLFVGNNKLESIVFAEQQAELDLLHAENNNLSEIDFSRIPSMSELIVSRNLLSGVVDLTPCASLSYVDLSYNKIESLKFAESVPNLKSLYVHYNKLKTLSVPSESLGILDATRNNLSALNIGQCNLVMALMLDFNNLNSLNLENKTSLLGLSIRQNNFGENALNNIYNQLPDISDVTPSPEYSSWMCLLNITGNPGSEASKTNIAESKGWTVVDNEELPELRNLTFKVYDKSGKAVEDAMFTLLLYGEEFQITPTETGNGIYKFIDFEVFLSYNYIIRVSHADYQPVLTDVIDFTGENVEITVVFEYGNGIEYFDENDLIVYGRKGDIFIKTSSLETIEIFNLTGNRLYTADVVGESVINGLQKGIYIVRAGQKVEKVFVK